MKTLEYVENYNAYQPYMLLNFNLSFEKDIAHDDICRTVIEVVEEVNIARYVDFTNRNTHGYDGVMMFKLIMLAMADRGYVSTRKLSKLCKTDIRYMFIAQNQKPSHQAFQRFIHDDLTMPIEDIFYEINKYIESKISINTDVLCIDGTKYEANANKNTFVWRANTIRNRTKRWKKVILCLKKINKYFAEQNIALNYSLLKEPSIEYMLAVADGIERYMKDYNIEFVHGKGKRKSNIQRLYDELKGHAIKLWEYAIHMELLGNRNSFSKTDPDATFMHMKYDYYNHTNVFKPGYNVQIGVSDGYIRNIYISSDGNDLRTYIPFMEKYKSAYGTLPKKTPADAGYGSYDNYMYCLKNGMELVMKYPMYAKKKEAKYKKQTYNPANWETDEEGYKVRPEGKRFDQYLSDRIDESGVYPRIIQRVTSQEECSGCPRKSECCKSKSGRKILSRDVVLNEFYQKVDENL